MGQMEELLADRGAVGGPETVDPCYLSNLGVSGAGRAGQERELPSCLGKVKSDWHWLVVHPGTSLKLIY